MRLVGAFGAASAPRRRLEPCPAERFGRGEPERVGPPDGAPVRRRVLEEGGRAACLVRRCVRELAARGGAGLA
eukprot:9012674-Alexandrium_andersonii.AAC.1